MIMGGLECVYSMELDKAEELGTEVSTEICSNVGATGALTISVSRLRFP